MQLASQHIHREDKIIANIDENSEERVNVE